MTSDYDRDKDTTPLAAANYEYLAQLVGDFKSTDTDIPEFLSEARVEQESFDYVAIREKFRKLAKQPHGCP